MSNNMTPERWRQVTELFHAAQSRATGAQAQYLDAACAGDRALRDEVAAMLAAHHDHGSFGDRPVSASIDAIQRLETGAMVGPYRVERLIGRGGMGEVYRARDTTLGRDVALKILPTSFATDPERLGRFEREARLLAALNHPHIAAIYGVEEADPSTSAGQGLVRALVLELVEGETLADRVGRGPVPVADALPIARQISEALEAAHEKGIIHRDLKPANITVTAKGVVKVLDFGLAKVFVAEGVGPDLSQSPTVTATAVRAGVIMGTAAYMSPEQARGQPVDKRTDVWAFGCVLYEMLTGRPAFLGDDVSDTIAGILRGDPDWNALPASTPAAVRKLLRGCLEKDRRERLPDIGVARLELKGTLSGSLTETVAPARAPVSPTSAAAVPRARRRDFAGWIVAVGLLLALLAALFGPWRRAPSAPAASVRFTVSPPRSTAFQGMLALSPDGRRLAFVATTADGRDVLWTRALDSLESRALEGTDGANYPFWSPDGRFLAFFAGGKLKKIEATGGSPQTLCDATAPRGGSWGSTGTIVFAANAGGQIERVAEAGGQATPLSHLTSKGNGDFFFRWPSFLPDGNRFLYFTIAGDTGRAGLSIASLDSPDTTWVTAADSGAAYVSPGFLFYRVGDRLMSQAFEAGQLRVTGEPVPFVEDVWWDGTSTLATAFSTSSGGIVAYQSGGLSSTRLLRYDRSGKELGSVGPSGAYLEPALSPDGRLLAVVRAEPGARGSAVWTIDLERGSLSRISSRSDVIVATPLWSPDGRRIVYAVYPSGEVYVRDAQGTEKEKLLYKAAAFTPLEDWSRDGRFLLYDLFDSLTFRSDVGVRDLEKGTDHLVLSATFNEFGARLSPDGRWLAYAANESGRPEVFVRSFPEAGVRQQVSTGGGTQPLWRGDGRELFYVSDDRKLMSVEVRASAELETGAPRPLFQTRILPLVEARNHYDVSADGQRFLVNSRRPEDALLPINVVVGWSPEKPR